MLTGLGLTYKRHANACLSSWTAMMLLMHGVQDLNLRAQASQLFNRTSRPWITASQPNATSTSAGRVPPPSLPL